MKALEKKINKFLKERGWDKLQPADVAKSIMIEGAELLEWFQWGSPSSADINLDETRKRGIREELADVFIYALELAVLLKFDAAAIIEEKLTAAARKYPARLMNQDVDPDTGVSRHYKQIKLQHRQDRYVQ